MNASCISIPEIISNIRIEIVVLPDNGEELDSWIARNVEGGPVPSSLVKEERLVRDGVDGVKQVRSVGFDRHAVVTVFMKKPYVFVITGLKSSGELDWVLDGLSFTK